MAQTITGHLIVAGMMKTGDTLETLVLSCHIALMAPCKKLGWAPAWQLKNESGVCMRVQVAL